MRTFLSQWLTRLAGWLRPRTASTPAAPPPGWTCHYFPIDAYRRLREPTPQELLLELKNTVYTCATLNAGVCAAFPPRLYVRTHPQQPEPRCPTRPLHPRHPLAQMHRGKSMIAEVLDHPLLTLLRQVNPVHNAHDLWELTTLYQEVHGSAYWLLDFDAGLGVPRAIWPLPSQQVIPRRAADSPNLVDYYEYRTGAITQRFSPREIIHFRYPDPRDPYCSGLSPLRAAFESAALGSQFLAYKRSIWDNAALPGVILSPTEVISEEERDRLEARWNQKFRRGGNGRVLVAESGLNVSVVASSLADVAALAEAGASRQDIATAFGVPLAFLTTQTNLANLQAADHQHASKAIRPRLRRRDEKLNEQLIPLYDPTGRLFLASDDPVGEDQDRDLKQQDSDLKHGVRTINEVRADRGLEPVEWGDKPWLPVNLAPTDFPHRTDVAPHSGRARDVQPGVE
jgi:HK97 family phage portal protein